MTEGNVFTSLGINPINLVGQIVNFGILFFILKKFLYQPILHKLDERSKHIAEGMKAADENIRKMEEVEAERKQKIEATQKEIEALLAEAKKDSARLKEETLAQAKTEAEQLMKRQENEIAELLTKQEHELQNKMVDIAAQVARKVLENYLDTKTQAELLDTQTKQLAETQLVSTTNR